MVDHVTQNADLGRVIDDLECLSIAVSRLCRNRHRIVEAPVGMTTCPADFPTWDRHPCGAELVDGWLVGEADDDVRAILQAAVDALKVLARNASSEST